MSDRDYASALKTADRELARSGMPLAAAARVWDELAAPRRVGWPVRRWAWVPAAAGVVALAVAVVRVVVAERAARPVGGFVVVGAANSVELAGDGSVGAPRAPCTLVEQSLGARLRVETGGRVRREPQGIRVVRGSVGFEFAHRSPGAPPARVLVSGGVFEVVGTRFVVTEDAAGGSVSLREGALLFTGVDGTARRLQAGESLSWRSDGLGRSGPGAVPRAPAPDRLAPAAPSIPPPPRRPPVRVDEVSRPAGVSEPADIAGVLERVATLRTRRLYEDAVDELTRALAGDLSRASRERLGFERASILTYLVGDRVRACRAWSDHRRLFPVGHYAREADEALAALGCAP